jgi:hypothetical protein
MGGCVVGGPRQLSSAPCPHCGAPQNDGRHQATGAVMMNRGWEWWYLRCPGLAPGWQLLYIGDPSRPTDG